MPRKSKKPPSTAATASEPDPLPVEPASPLPAEDGGEVASAPAGGPPVLSPQSAAADREVTAAPAGDGSGASGGASAETAHSRRKQKRPHRVTECEDAAPAPAAAAPLHTFGTAVLLRVPEKGGGAGPALAAAASALASSLAPRTSSSLMASLKGKRPPKPRQDLPMVKCGGCNEQFNERAFERHILSAHQGLARPAGQSQEFNKTEQLRAFNRVLKTGGTLSCKVCHKSLSSALGFYLHTTQCGNEVEPVKCPKCNWFLKPLSLAGHLKKHERQERIAEQKAAECVNPPPKKRSRNSVPNYKEGDGDADGDGDEDYNPETNSQNGTPGRQNMRGFTAPRSSPHPRTVAKWRRRMVSEGTMHCEMPGCSFETNSVSVMVDHYPKCPSMPDKWKVYSCDQCKKQAGSEPEMVEHVRREHPSVKPPHARWTRSTEGVPTPARRQRRPGTISCELAGDLTYFTPVERQACPRENTAKYWAQLPKTRGLVTAKQTLTDWWRCTPQEQSSYAPPMKLSPAYKVQEIGNADQYRSFERLDAFAFEELDNGVLCFCGGPVIACDWCPCPVPGPEERQYLAVCCLPVVDRPIPPTQPSALPSVVQLWSFTNDRRSARMEYAVCVDGGPVWDLAWCPVGRRSPSAPERLGSLALACGDGRIRIYGMPAPHCLTEGKTDEPPFYVKRADMRLELFGESHRTPCCRLDWAKSDANRSVAGIFGDGVVAIWDLLTTSPILREADGGTRLLYPVQVIPAHRGHGTAVTFSPAADRFFCSGGRDRVLQMWDREEPAALQRNSSKLRPTLTDVCWPIGTKKLINAYDTSLFVGSPSIMMSDAALPVQDMPLFTHAAKCSSVDVNTTVNGLACGSESGLVALGLWRSMLSHKQRHELRRLLLRLECERLEPQATPGAEQLLGDKYSQVWESCGLTIWEAKMHEKTGVIQEAFDDYVSDSGSWVSNYPFVAVNKVRWNRNAECDSWLAVGMECGFLRVLEVPADAFSIVKS